MYHGNGDGTFTPVSEGNFALEHPYSDYGLAMADFDQDGDLDLIVATTKSSTQPGLALLRNDASEGHWMQVKLWARWTTATPSAPGPPTTAAPPTWTRSTSARDTLGRAPSTCTGDLEH